MKKVLRMKSKFLVLLVMILAAAFMLYGCTGDAGPQGAQGPAGSNVGTVSGTVSGPGGGLGGVTVSNNITSDTTTTDSSGNFSLSLPIGTYTLSFSKSGYTSATAAANVAAAGSSSVVAVTMSESASGLPSVVISTDKNEVGFGNNVNLTATVTPGSNGGTVAKYAWSVTPPSAGSAQGLGKIVGATDGPTAVVQMPVMNDPVKFRGAFDGTVTTINGHIYQTWPYDYEPETDLLGNPAPAGTIVTADGNFVAPFVPENRIGVLPLLADTRGAVTPKLVVTDSLGGTVSAGMPATQPLYASGVQGGVKDVALGQPCYVNSGHDTGNAWTLTAPAGSAATLSSASARYPFFVPDVQGAYTLTEGANSMVIYAGKFVGVVANSSSSASYTSKTFDLNNPEDADKAGMWYTAPASGTLVTFNNTWPVVVPDSGCLACHFNNFQVNGLTAYNKFTPWTQTAHATFFARGLDGITSNSGSCLTCHTTGYDLSILANNGGFDDVAAANGWTYPSNRVSGNWGKLFDDAKTAAVGRLGNIQCENCHGPQNTSSADAPTGAHISGLKGGTTGAAGGTRVTYGAEDCGVCHASGTGHHNYSEWLVVNPGLPGPAVTINVPGVTPYTINTVAGEEGHGHSKIAQLNVTGYTGHAQATSTSCSRCHTAEGFAAYVKQLQQYSSANNDAVGVLSPKYVPDSFQSDQKTLVWTADNAHSQTCNACHDPHDDTNPNQLRVYDSVPMTIVGVGVTGLGKGAICTVCHNSRNGVKTDNTPFLHEDDDPYALTVIDTPHDNTQAEVLLGRDAFFMEGQLPMLSKHANIEDSCVGCHMALNPAIHLSHGAQAQSGHQFFINDGDRPKLCGNCHGNGDNVNGQGLVANTQNQFAALSAAMGPAMMSQLPAGTIYLNKTAVSVASIAKISFNNTAADPTLLTAAGASRFYFYDAANNLLPAGATSGFTVAQITTDAAGKNYVFGPASKFRKAVWNYQLIGKDYSYGVHNPSFVTTVLAQTIAAIKNPNLQ